MYMYHSGKINLFKATGYYHLLYVQFFLSLQLLCAWCSTKVLFKLSEYGAIVTNVSAKI